MSKKDYVWLAGILREERLACIAEGNRAEAGLTERVAVRLTNRLKDDNPRFDADRFMAAVLKD